MEQCPKNGKSPVVALNKGEGDEEKCIRNKEPRGSKKRTKRTGDKEKKASCRRTAEGPHFSNSKSRKVDRNKGSPERESITKKNTMGRLAQNQVEKGRGIGRE